MGRETTQTGERKTRRAIVKLLKTEGPLGTAQLAERLGLTAMAVRLHLYALQGEGLVTAEDVPVPVGRPAKSWRLTREADRHFPEAYAELSVALIDAMRDTFGADGPVELAPFDPLAICDAIERLLDDIMLRAERSRAGAELVANRTWARAAEQVEAGLRAALS